jgi:hypothetical protein
MRFATANPAGMPNEDRSQREERICRDSVGWVMCKRSAARPQ